MLSHANLPKTYWAEAVATAVHIQNRLPTSAFQGMTPYEQWYGRKPDVSRMRVFGCTAYALVPDVDCQKLDKKTVKLQFVGYAKNAKGYRLLSENSRKILIRRDVVFNKQDFGQNTEPKNACVPNEMSVTEKEVGYQEVGRNDNGLGVRNRRPPIRYGYDEYADKVVADH